LDLEVEDEEMDDYYVDPMCAAHWMYGTNKKELRASD
jgi:hypothetical protein